MSENRAMAATRIAGLVMLLALLAGCGDGGEGLLDKPKSWTDVAFLAVFLGGMALIMFACNWERKK